MERRFVKKEWTVPMRLNHWIMALAIFSLIATGFYIASPFSIPGGETTWKFFMGNARVIHIAFGLVLTLIFIWRVYLMFFSRFHADWKDFFAFFDIRNTIQQLKFYALITRKPPEHKFLYGPMQSLAYGGCILMLFFIVLTGIILTGACYHAGITAWAYEALRPVETMMGGLAGVCFWHHICTWAFVLCFVVHLYMAFWYDQVFKVGTVSSMIGGRLFEREEH